MFLTVLPSCLWNMVYLYTRYLYPPALYYWDGHILQVSFAKWIDKRSKTSALLLGHSALGVTLLL